MSAALIRFRITPDGGESFNVDANSRDVLVWERTTRGSYANLMRNQQMADLYRIAHIAARRLGLYEGDLPTFESTCDLENIVDEEEDESASDPTRPAQSPGPQSP